MSPVRIWDTSAARSSNYILVRLSLSQEDGSLPDVNLKQNCSSQGHVSHAVGPAFHLESGDLLYFSGQIKQAKHYSEQFNLELLTNETEADSAGKGSALAADLKSAEEGAEQPSHAAQLLQVRARHVSTILLRPAPRKCGDEMACFRGILSPLLISL